MTRCQPTGLFRESGGRREGGRARTRERTKRYHVGAEREKEREQEDETERLAGWEVVRMLGRK